MTHLEENSLIINPTPQAGMYNSLMAQGRKKEAGVYIVKYLKAFRYSDANGQVLLKVGNSLNVHTGTDAQ